MEELLTELTGLAELRSWRRRVTELAESAGLAEMANLTEFSQLSKLTKLAERAELALKSESSELAPLAELAELTGLSELAELTKSSEWVELTARRPSNSLQFLPRRLLALMRSAHLPKTRTEAPIRATPTTPTGLRPNWNTGGIRPGMP